MFCVVWNALCVVYICSVMCVACCMLRVAWCVLCRVCCVLCVACCVLCVVKSHGKKYSLLLFLFLAPRSFIHEKNFWDGPLINYDVNVGTSFELPCPDRVPGASETIKWSVIVKNKAVDFSLSERVWVTSNGNLYFAYVVEKDIDFINDNGGIRCNLGSTLMAGRPFEGSNLIKLVKKGIWKGLGLSLDKKY